MEKTNIWDAVTNLFIVAGVVIVISGFQGCAKRSDEINAVNSIMRSSSITKAIEQGIPPLCAATVYSSGLSGETIRLAINKGCKGIKEKGEK